MCVDFGGASECASAARSQTARDAMRHCLHTQLTTHSEGLRHHLVSHTTLHNTHLARQQQPHTRADGCHRGRGQAPDRRARLRRVGVHGPPGVRAPGPRLWQGARARAWGGGGRCIAKKNNCARAQPRSALLSHAHTRAPRRARCGGRWPAATRARWTRSRTSSPSSTPPSR